MFGNDALNKEAELVGCTSLSHILSFYRRDLHSALETARKTTKSESVSESVCRAAGRKSQRIAIIT